MRQRDLDDLNKLLAFYDVHKPNMLGKDVPTNMSAEDVAVFARREPGGKFMHKGYAIIPARARGRTPPHRRPR